MSYASIHDHRQMVMDQRRNDLYYAALKDVIRPGMTVMDLGAGLGLHAHMAAQLGAARVYLVEPELILHTTEKLLSNSNYGDRMVYLNQRIEDVATIERVDVIVSVFTGNFLVMEDLLPSLFHARDHWLVNNGVMLPSSAAMHIAPVSMPRFYDDYINAWSDEIYDLPLNSLRTFASNSVYTCTADNEPQLLGNAADLAHFNLTTASNTDVDANVQLTVSTSGVCHGFLGWFTADLAGHTLTTAPDAPALHWSQAFLPLPQPVNVNAGDVFSFALKRPDFGDWTWTVSVGESRTRQSTFLGRVHPPQSLAVRSPNHQPNINRRGTALTRLLGKLDGNTSVDDLTTWLRNDFGDVFLNDAAARDFVAVVVERYGE